MFKWVIAMFWMFLVPSAFGAVVVDGRLDLSGATLGPQSELSLGGPWRFYPEVFLEAADIQAGALQTKASVLLNVPGDIVGRAGPDGQKLKSEIWGSFVLELCNVPAWMPELALRLRGDTAYKVLLIDGEGASQFITQAGLPATRSQESIPQVIEQLGRFPAPVGPGPFYLVVQLSGFFYGSPGLWMLPTIGPSRAMERERDWIRLSECVIIGMLLIMTLYNVSLYLHRREDVGYLWVAGFTTLVLMRFTATSGHVTAFLFPHSSADLFELIRKVEFGAMALSCSCLLAFAVRTFGFRSFDRYLLWNHVPVGLFTTVIALTDVTFYRKLLPVILLHWLLISAVVLVLLLIIILAKQFLN